MEKFTSILALLVFISGICSVYGQGGRFPARTRPLIPRKPQAHQGNIHKKNQGNLNQQQNNRGQAKPRKQNNQKKSGMYPQTTGGFPGMNRGPFTPFCPWVAPGDCPELNISPHCVSWDMMSYMGQPCRGCTFDWCERNGQNGMEINQDLLQMGYHSMHYMNYMNSFANQMWGNARGSTGNTNMPANAQAKSHATSNPQTTMNPWMMAYLLS